METYLYFRKFRPATFLSTQGSATQTLNTITGLGGDDIDSNTEIASLTVTSVDASNSNIGSNYTAISETGQQTSLALSAINGTTTNSVITFDNSISLVVISALLFISIFLILSLINEFFAYSVIRFLSSFFKFGFKDTKYFFSKSRSKLVIISSFILATINISL